MKLEIQRVNQKINKIEELMTTFLDQVSKNSLQVIPAPATTISSTNQVGWWIMSQLLFKKIVSLLNLALEKQWGNWQAWVRSPKSELGPESLNHKSKNRTKVFRLRLVLHDQGKGSNQRPICFKSRNSKVLQGAHGNEVSQVKNSNFEHWLYFTHTTFI